MKQTLFCSLLLSILLFLALLKGLWLHKGFDKVPGPGAARCPCEIAEKVCCGQEGHRAEQGAGLVSLGLTSEEEDCGEMLMTFFLSCCLLRGGSVCRSRLSSSAQKAEWWRC